MGRSKVFHQPALTYGTGFDRTKMDGSHEWPVGPPLDSDPPHR